MCWQIWLNFNDLFAVWCYVVDAEFCENPILFDGVMNMCSGVHFSQTQCTLQTATACWNYKLQVSLESINLLFSIVDMQAKCQANASVGDLFNKHNKTYRLQSSEWSISQVTMQMIFHNVYATCLLYYKSVKHYFFAGSWFHVLDM